MKIIIRLLLVFLLTLLNAEPYFELWPNDSLKIKGEYKNGYKSGKWEYYNLNGKVWKYEVFQNGKIIDEMKWQIFKPKQSEIDALEAKLKEQSENRIIESVNQELKDTTQKESSFLEGYTGNWIEYHDNGKLDCVIEYMNGLKHGKANYYDEAERLIRTERYLSGKKHGKWVWYWENKKVKETGYYNSDRKHGKWIKYDKAGNQILVKDFY